MANSSRMSDIKEKHIFTQYHTYYILKFLKK